MEKKDALTKVLALVGTGLVWFPVVGPLVLGVLRLMAGARFLFDYLMPGELFPAILVGGGLLLWAALRARMRRRPIAWALGTAAGLLAASQGLALVTGLASGKIEPSGPWFVLVVVLYAGYCAAAVALGVAGILLVRDLLGRRPQA
ncbi:MAG TPA: hypothetical protein PKO09_02695 [Anaerolineae bacterium]|nr:hypothetical protein [Anaerolineae bacterium]